MKKQLVTSALPYINGVKHLGNLVGSMLPADVYAQYLRQTGHETLFICATDDHGTPAEIAAQKANQSTAQFCTEQHEVQKNIYQRFGLRFDHFGRTSHQANIELTQQFGETLFKNGLAEIREIQQVFSHADNRFLPDRYIEGTCPHCGYDKARGDQCENCTKVLDPTDLVNPRSAISGSTELEVRSTKHLFLKLSTMADKIRSWVDEQITWPHIVKSIAYKWLDEGLHDRCITRDLDWGVPVTGIEGLEGKVYYVWFDAPIGYIGATKELLPDTYKDWWYNAEDTVEYTQFMAKDNIPFHTISFPATLLGLNEPWKTVDFIKGYNWLTFYGGKFSTSQQIGVFTDKALDLLPADAWRYYLMARAPESDDSSFTWEDLQAVVNKDLADVLGNFVNRVSTFSQKKFGNTIPTQTEWTENDTKFLNEFIELLNTLNAQYKAKELRKATTTFREMCALGNEYLATNEPWQTIKTDEARAATTLSIALNYVRVLAVLANPIIPNTALKLATAFNSVEDLNGWIEPDDSELQKIIGETFTVPEILIQKITDEQIASFSAQYGGAELAAA